MACRWVRFAYRVLPLPAWRAFLLDRHIDRCPRCRGEALDDAAIRSLGVTSAGLGNEPPLSPFACDSRPVRKSASAPAWRYAFGFFLAAVIFGGAFAVWRIIPTATLPQGIVTVSEAEDDGNVFAVLEARIGDEPARPVIFKPGQPGLTIVWFEKTKKMD